jgi:hypothetical protein
MTGWIQKERELQEFEDPFGGLGYSPQARPYLVQWISRPIDSFKLNPYLAWRAVSFFIGGTEVTRPIGEYLRQHNILALPIDRLREPTFPRVDVILVHPSHTPEGIISQLSDEAYGRPDQFDVEML